MSEQSVTAALFKKVLRLGVIYVVLQVVVGIEVAFVIVYLHLWNGLSIPSATVTAMPVGLPLLLAQGALYLAYKSGKLGKLLRRSDP